MPFPTYISDDELKKTLTLANTTFIDEDITRATKAASRAIDEMAGRTFYPSPALDPADDDYEPEVRYFTADNRHRIEVDDLLAVTELATSNGSTFTVWDTADYVLEPLNNAVKGRPYDTIRAQRSRRCFGGYHGVIHGGVRVTGRFGWAEPPDQVVQLATILASKLVKRAREAPFGIVAFGGEVTAAIRIARTDPDMAMLLDGLERKAVLA